MLFQLILQGTEWYQYLINIFVVIFGRFLDIGSTRYVTRELKLETNKLAKKLGWKGMVLIQMPLIILGALDFYFALFILFWSLYLFANNMEGSWYVQEVGEEVYHEELKTGVKRTSVGKIILGEISPILSLTISGILILIFLFIYNDLIAIFFICLALICQGILGTLRSLSYLIDLKKDAPQKEEKNAEASKMEEPSP